MIADRDLHHEPDRTVRPVDARAPASADRVECPRCGKTYQAGAVVDGPTDYCELVYCHATTRKLYCDHCDVVICWAERWDPIRRRLTGEVVIGPGYLKGACVQRFLAEHPEARGVEQT